MSKLWVAPVVLILVVVGGTVYWFHRHGNSFHAVYVRILPGMPLAEVEGILGGPGVVVSERDLPGIVDWRIPLEDPNRVKAVVAGDRYLWWEHGGSTIFVGFRDGKVMDKWYGEPSI